MKSNMPVHAWVYGMFRMGASREEGQALVRGRGYGYVPMPSRESWRMACGATFCGVSENFRVFGPTRLRVVWPLRRHLVTCEACRAAVDALAPSKTLRNPHGTAYVAQLIARVEAMESREFAARSA